MRRVEGKKLADARAIIMRWGYDHVLPDPEPGTELIWFDQKTKSLRQVKVVGPSTMKRRLEVETTEDSDSELDSSPAGAKYNAELVDLYAGPEPAEPGIGIEYEDACCNCGWPSHEHANGGKGCGDYMEPTLENKLIALSRTFQGETRELLLAGAAEANRSEAFKERSVERGKQLGAIDQAIDFRGVPEKLVEAVHGLGEPKTRGQLLERAAELLRRARDMDAPQGSADSGTCHIDVYRHRSHMGYTVALVAEDMSFDLGPMLDVSYTSATKLRELLEEFVRRLPRRGMHEREDERPQPPIALDFVMDRRAAFDAIREVLRMDHHGGNPDNCPIPECTACAFVDCHRADPLHYHHDGCPSCAQEDPGDA